MKITLSTILLFLVAQLSFAQFNAEDIQFWVGEGDSECYLAVDFRDGSTDPSFAWGIKYNAEDELTFADLFVAIAAVEPNFTYDNPGGFLNDVIYNSHIRTAGDPDYWSTWSGDSSETMNMNGGVSEDLEHERWFGISYGFSPPEMPTITYPAYSSLWFSADELEYELGEGNDYAVIVVDFVDEIDGEPVSFAWKVKFDGSISSQDALQLISDNDSEFEVVFDENQIASINYKTLEGEEWLSYTGTDMSNWLLAEDDIILENEDWYGISKGSTYTRRPFIPVSAEENPILEMNDLVKNSLTFYPNPVKDYLNIKSDENIENISLYNMLGQLVLEHKVNEAFSTMDVSALNSGAYLMQLFVNGRISTYRVFKN